MTSEEEDGKRKRKQKIKKEFKKRFLFYLTYSHDIESLF